MEMVDSTSRLPFILAEIVQNESILVSSHKSEQSRAHQHIVHLLQEFSKEIMKNQRSSTEVDTVLKHFLRCIMRLLNFYVSNQDKNEEFLLTVLETFITTAKCKQLSPNFEAEGREMTATMSIITGIVQRNWQGQSVDDSISSRLFSLCLNCLQFLVLTLSAVKDEPVTGHDLEGDLSNAISHILHCLVVSWSTHYNSVLHATLCCFKTLLQHLSHWTNFWRASLPGLFSSLSKLLVSRATGTHHNRIPLRLKCDVFACLCSLLLNVAHLTTDNGTRLSWISMNSLEARSNSTIETPPLSELQRKAQELIRQTKDRLSKLNDQNSDVNNTESSISSLSLGPTENELQWRVDVLQRIAPIFQSLFLSLLKACFVPGQQNVSLMVTIIQTAILQLIRNSGDFFGVETCSQWVLSLVEIVSDSDNMDDTDNFRDTGDQMSTLDRFILSKCWSSLQTQLVSALHIVNADQNMAISRFYALLRGSLFNEWKSRWIELRKNAAFNEHTVKNLRVLLCFSTLVIWLSPENHRLTHVESFTYQFNILFQKYPELSDNVKLALIALFTPGKNMSTSTTVKNVTVASKAKFFPHRTLNLSHISKASVNSDLIQNHCSYKNSNKMSENSNNNSETQENEFDERYLSVYTADFESMVSTSFYEKDVSSFSFDSVFNISEAQFSNLSERLAGVVMRHSVGIRRHIIQKLDRDIYQIEKRLSRSKDDNRDESLNSKIVLSDSDSEDDTDEYDSDNIDDSDNYDGHPSSNSNVYLLAETIALHRLCFAHLQARLHFSYYLRPTNFNINLNVQNDDKREMSSDRSLSTCAYCGSCEGLTSNKQLLRCSRCKQVAYCQVAHQKQHWSLHKLVCKAPVKSSKDVLSANTLASHNNSNYYYCEYGWQEVCGGTTLASLLTEPSLLLRSGLVKDVCVVSPLSVPEKSVSSCDTNGINFSKFVGADMDEYISEREAFFNNSSQLCDILSNYKNNTNKFDGKEALLVELLTVSQCVALQYLSVFYSPMYKFSNKRTDKEETREMEHFQAKVLYNLLSFATQDMTTTGNLNLGNQSNEEVFFGNASLQDISDTYLYLNEQNTNETTKTKSSLLLHMLKRFGSETSAVSLLALTAATVMKRLSLTLFLRNRLIETQHNCNNNSDNNDEERYSVKQLRYILSPLIEADSMCLASTSEHGLCVTDASLQWLCVTQLDRIVEGLCRTLRNYQLFATNSFLQTCKRSRQLKNIGNNSKNSDDNTSSRHVVTRVSHFNILERAPKTLLFALTLLRSRTGDTLCDTPCGTPAAANNQTVLLLHCVKEVKRLLLNQPFQFSMLNLDAVSQREVSLQVLCVLLRHLLLCDSPTTSCHDTPKPKLETHEDTPYEDMFLSLMKFQMSLTTMTRQNRSLHGDKSDTDNNTETSTLREKKNETPRKTLTPTQRDTATLCRELMSLLLPLLPPTVSRDRDQLDVSSEIFLRLRHCDTLATEAVSLILLRLHSLHLLVSASKRDKSETDNEHEYEERNEENNEKEKEEENEEVFLQFLPTVSSLWQRLLPVMTHATQTLRVFLSQKATLCLNSSLYRDTSTNRSNSANLVKRTIKNRNGTKTSGDVITVLGHTRTQQDTDDNDDTEVLNKGVLFLPGGSAIGGELIAEGQTKKKPLIAEAKPLIAEVKPLIAEVKRPSLIQEISSDTSDVLSAENSNNKPTKIDGDKSSVIDLSPKDTRETQSQKKSKLPLSAPTATLKDVLSLSRTEMHQDTDDGNSNNSERVIHNLFTRDTAATQEQLTTVSEKKNSKTKHIDSKISSFLKADEGNSRTLGHRSSRDTRDTVISPWLLWLPSACDLFTQILCISPRMFLKDKVETTLWPVCVPSLLCLALLLQLQLEKKSFQFQLDAKFQNYSVSLLRLCVTMCRRGFLPCIETQRAVSPVISMLLRTFHQWKTVKSSDKDKEEKCWTLVEGLLMELETKLSSGTHATRSRNTAINNMLWLKDVQKTISSKTNVTGDSADKKSYMSQLQRDTLFTAARDTAQLAATVSLFISNAAKSGDKNLILIEHKNDADNEGYSVTHDARYVSQLERFSSVH